MGTRRYVRVLLSTLLVLVPALVGVLAGAIAQSEAAGLPGAQAAHGSDHTLLIKPDGSLWSWGANGSGQLGNGTTTGMPVAIRVGAATDWVAVACGDLYSFGIRGGGSLWAWGFNAGGQLGLGDTDDRTTPQRVGSDTDWVAVACGDDHVLALKSDGSLWAWGSNAYGQLGLGDTTDVSTPTQVGAATDWDAISSGSDFSTALKDDGTLWVWGRNNRSQLGLGDTAVRLAPVQLGNDTDWASVHCGDEDVRALKSSGTLWAWGYNFWGQLGLGDKVIRTEPTQVGTDSDWEEFACGDDHTAALKSGGSLWAWGDNNYGQLGQGDRVELTSPTQVGSATNWSRVLCGDDFTTALRSGDELWGFGDNQSGDLSLGDVTDRLTPTLLFMPSDETAPAIGSLTSSTHADPAVWYPLADPGFAWSASDASGIAGYRWDRDQLAGTAAPTGYPSANTAVSYTALADGVHYFHLRAVDRAGNWGPTSTRAVRVDTTAPSVTPVRPVEGATYAQGSTVPCAWTSDDVHSGIATDTARLDGSPIAEGAALDTDATGDHTFVVTATDEAGNERAISLAYSVEPPLSFTIAPSAGPHGSISPDAAQTVEAGADQTFTFAPDDGYGVAAVIVDGEPIGATPASYTFRGVDADHTIRVTFARQTFTITPTSGDNGSISPDAAQAVDAGADLTFTITPDTGYHVADVLVDGESVGPVTSYPFTNVTADHTISATFALDTFEITPTAGPNGSISPATPQTVDSGADVTFTITPDTGYHVADVLVDGESVGPVTSYPFTNVTADHTISATFAIETYTIAPSAGANGSITPSVDQTVEYGQARTFTIRPVSGYYIADVLIDGVSTGPVTSYTFGAVEADHTISASFAPGVQPTLWIGVTKTVVTYGSSALLRGELSLSAENDLGTAVGLGGRTVVVEQTSTPNLPSSWRILATYTTSSESATLGELVPPLEITPTAPISYRLRYAKEPQSQYGPAASVVKSVRVRPLLGRPVVPTSVRAGRWFILYGSLKPHFTAGEKTVKVKAYRYKNRRWVYVKTLTATNVDNGDFTKYRLRTRFTTRGTYRFRATTTAPGWAVATSSDSKRLVVR